MGEDTHPDSLLVEQGRDSTRESQETDEVCEGKDALKVIGAKTREEDKDGQNRHNTNDAPAS